MPAEDQLVLLCCAAPAREIDPEQVTPAIERVRDWALVLGTCRANNVVVPAADVLGYHASVPRAVRSRFLAEAMRVRAHVRERQAGFEAVLPRVLERHQVVLLRGIAFCYTLYKDAPRRAMGDIDLLIDKPLVPSISGRFCDHHHVPAAVAQHAGALVEYHHDLNMWDGVRAAAIDMRALWERQQPLEVNGMGVGVLAPEDNVLYLSYHNVIKGFVGLYRLLDLMMLARAHPLDWDAIARRAIAYRVARAVWLNLRIARGMAPAIVPREIVKALQPPAPFDRVLLGCASLENVLHDPNPVLTPSRRQSWRNVRKQALMRLAIHRLADIHKLPLYAAMRVALRAYRAAYRVPALAAFLRQARARVQLASASRR